MKDVTGNINESTTKDSVRREFSHRIYVVAAQIELMAPILERTEWYKSYSGQVQGALKAACMRDGAGSCVAVCLDGGPVSRVESRNMVPNSPSDSAHSTHVSDYKCGPRC